MNPSHSTRAKQEIGGRVSDIELPEVGGKRGSLRSFLDGRKGAVVVFWSETCSHCIHYDSYLNGFAPRHPELGLMIIASRQGENLAEIRKTASARNLQFPIHYDSGGNVAKEWYTQQTPRVFLIDPDQKLLYRGAIDNFEFPEDPEYQPYLESAIEAFLSGKPIQRTETASFGCAIQSVYYNLPKPL